MKRISSILILGLFASHIYAAPITIREAVFSTKSITKEITEAAKAKCNNLNSCEIFVPEYVGSAYSTPYQYRIEYICNGSMKTKYNKNKKSEIIKIKCLSSEEKFEKRKRNIKIGGAIIGGALSVAATVLGGIFLH